MTVRIGAEIVKVSVLAGSDPEQALMPAMLDAWPKLLDRPLPKDTSRVRKCLRADVVRTDPTLDTRYQLVVVQVWTADRCDDDGRTCDRHD